VPVGRGAAGGAAVPRGRAVGAVSAARTVSSAVSFAAQSAQSAQESVCSQYSAVSAGAAGGLCDEGRCDAVGQAGAVALGPSERVLAIREECAGF
jgi:hypothetical protein